MATELGKAYVQIVPSAKGISGSISKELGGEATSAGKSAGMNIAGTIKGVLLAAGIGEALKASLEAGGAMQQSFGGLDTLYEDAAQAAKDYAVEAAKAGISANDYAEQAVSFGASLKKAFGGDTTKAMEAANTAILDMADNSAKMGTDIGSIQMAYQGFAKQNYTMLDNLKLGYGGTKTEMERLLTDAQKLSGVEYNIDNLGDVYEAIHVIQEDLNLTGVAAEEASSTFTGSLGAMKASLTNLLANLSLGNDIGPSLNALQETVRTFLLNNLLPMVGNILKSLPDLVSGVGSMLIGALNIASNNAAEIAQIAIDLVTSLVTAIVEAAPYIVEAAWNLATSLGTALIETDWVGIGTELIENLRNAIDLAAGEILGADTGTIRSFLDSITAGLPNVLNKGVEIISNVVNGILSSLPEIIRSAATMLKTWVDFIMANLPTILQAGMTLLHNICQGILDNLPEIISATVDLISTLLSTLVEHLPEIISMGYELVTQLIVGLIQALPDLISGVFQLIGGIADTFASYNWLEIGVNLVQGIINGIKSMAGAIWDAAKSVALSAFNAAKDALGIESPAKKGIYVGEMLDAGFAKGVSENADVVDTAISDLANDATATLSLATKAGEFDVSTTTNNKMDVLIAMLSAYLPEIAENKGMTVSDMMNGINRQLGWALQ